MGPTAKVISIDVLTAMSVALRRFEEEGAAAVTDLEMETGRAVDWFERQRQYWQEQVRRGWDRVGQARIALERAKMMQFGDHRPTAYDEQKELDKAKARLAVAEEKYRVTKHWQHLIEREVTEFRGTLNQLSGYLQIELPKALAILKRMTRSLEDYLAAQTRSADVPPPVWSNIVGAETVAGEIGSAARPEGEPSPSSAAASPVAAEGQNADAPPPPTADEVKP